MTRRAARASWLVPAACALLGLVLLLPKPLHIDDPFYLRIAEQIARTPLNPYSFHLNWWGNPQPAYETALSPPLFSYWLAAAVALFGHNLLALHLFAAVFIVIAAFACWSLAARFTTFPGVVTALVMLSPAVLPSANLMLDVPALGLVLGALALHVSGEDRSRGSAKAAAALLAAAAVLTKYQAGGVCLLMAAYSLVKRRPASLVWQLLPISAFLGWMLWTNHLYGLPQIVASHPVFSESTRRRVMAYLLALGASAVVLPVLFALHWRNRSRVWVLCAALLLAVAAARGALRVDEATLETFLFSTNGLLWLLTIAWPRASHEASGDHKRDSAFVFLWAGLFPLLGIVGAPFPALRHLLLSLPAFVILAFRGLQPAANRSMRLVMGLCVTATAALGIAVALADIEFARVYPAAAPRAAALGPQGHVWYLGHWGWQYYADQAGMKQLSSEQVSLPTGDVVVVPREPDVQPPAPQLAARLRLVTSVEVSGRLPVRIVNTEARAGFYASPLPRLPYTFAHTPLERFQVYRVAPAAPAAPSPATLMR